MRRTRERDRVMKGRMTLLIGACLVAAAPVQAAAQIPEVFTNLRHFPEDITRDSLIGVMRSFSFGLGVRCQYCHVGGDGISFEGVDFASDDDPDKRKARWMLDMVRDLNRRLDDELPERDDPPVEVGCKTCHRGIPRPILLAQELRITLDTSGRAALDSAYAQARTALEDGIYDFGEWEVNVLAEALEAEGRVDDAVAVWELNGRHHPESRSILMTLARLYEERGEVEAALAKYRRVLELNPEDEAALSRVRALGGG